LDTALWEIYPPLSASIVGLAWSLFGRLPRVGRWHLPGLLCIGDAAHAMSPAGVLESIWQSKMQWQRQIYYPYRFAPGTALILKRVQQRRECPTRVTQFLQVNAHKALNAGFKTDGPIQAPWQLKVVDALARRKWFWDTSSVLAFGRSMWRMPKGCACRGPYKRP
jgi:hypothetical protein